jgi:transcriptional regulator with XRE-family HTH domain
MTQEMLARKLRVLRAERGITLHEAEELTGVTRETLGALEHGQRGAYTSTLQKIADGYGVTIGELMQEEESRVPITGKDQAPQGSGRPETAPPAEEEEPTVVPQSAGVLKASVDLIKRLKRYHESDLEKILQGQLDYDGVLRMEMVNKGVRCSLNEHGILDFAEAVRADRELAETEAAPLCHALLRELRYLEGLTDEARTTAAMRSSDIREEVEKDVWQLSERSWVVGERERGV